MSHRAGLITRASCVIRPKGSDLTFDHPYNDALMFVKGAREPIPISAVTVGVAGYFFVRAGLLGCGQDRDGPLGWRASSY